MGGRLESPGGVVFPMYIDALLCKKNLHKFYEVFQLFFICIVIFIERIISDENH